MLEKDVRKRRCSPAARPGLLCLGQVEQKLRFCWMLCMGLANRRGGGGLGGAFFMQPLGELQVIKPGGGAIGATALLDQRVPLITRGALAGTGGSQVLKHAHRIEKYLDRDHESGPPRRGGSLLYQPPMLPDVDPGRLVSADVVGQHLLAVGGLLWIAVVIEPGALLHIADRKSTRLNSS